VYKKFQPILQHDSHELFIFLVTHLSEELQLLNSGQTTSTNQPAQGEVTMVAKYADSGEFNTQSD
jgi:hypothetical protein